MRTFTKTILATALITASAASLAQQDSSRSTLRWTAPVQGVTPGYTPPTPTAAAVENMGDWFARNAGKSLTVAVIRRTDSFGFTQSAGANGNVYRYNGTLNDELTVFTISVAGNDVNVLSDAYTSPPYFGTSRLARPQLSYSFSRSYLENPYNTYPGFLARDQSSPNLAWRFIGIPARNGGIPAETTGANTSTTIDQLVFVNTGYRIGGVVSDAIFNRINALGIPPSKVIYVDDVRPIGPSIDPAGND